MPPLRRRLAPLLLLAASAAGLASGEGSQSESESQSQSQSQPLPAAASALPFPPATALRGSSSSSSSSSEFSSSSGFESSPSSSSRELQGTTYRCPTSCIRAGGPMVFRFTGEQCTQTMAGQNGKVWGHALNPGQWSCASSFGAITGASEYRVTVMGRRIDVTGTSPDLANQRHLYGNWVVRPGTDLTFDCDRNRMPELAPGDCRDFQVMTSRWDVGADGKKGWLPVQVVNFPAERLLPGERFGSVGVVEASCACTHAAQGGTMVWQVPPQSYYPAPTYLRPGPAPAPAPAHAPAPAAAGAYQAPTYNPYQNPHSTSTTAASSSSSSRVRPLVSTSSKGCGKGGCGECEGDCDSDGDCTGALRCYFRNGTEAVPGCGGGTVVSGWDYCAVDPTSSAAAAASPSVVPNPAPAPAPGAIPARDVVSAARQSGTVSSQAYVYSAPGEVTNGYTVTVYSF